MVFFDWQLKCSTFTVIKSIPLYISGSENLGNHYRVNVKPEVKMYYAVVFKNFKNWYNVNQVILFFYHQENINKIRL